MHENHQQPEFVVAFIAPFANSFAQNQPYIEVKSYSLKLLLAMKKIEHRYLVP